MTNQFEFVPEPSQTAFRVLGPRGPLSVDRWALEAPAALLPGIDLLRRLVAEEAAVAADDTMLVENAVVAGLTMREAAALGLPSLAPAAAYVATSGVITRADFTATLEWRHPNRQRIMGAVRVGAFLRIGDSWHRLPDTLFAVAESVDDLAAAGADETRRFAAMAKLGEALPPAEDEGTAEASGLARTLTIRVAGAFSLGLDGEGDDARLVPVLHGTAGEPDEPLLDEETQRTFGTRHFNAFGTARPVYAVGGGTYVVLTPVARRALDVVRRTQARPLSAKLALLAQPRAVLGEALGDDVDEAVIEGVVRDTAAYAQRVLGLGLWQKRVLPWVAQSGTNWLEGDAETGAAPSGKRAGGIVIGDRRYTLDPDKAGELRQQVEQAIVDGQPSATFIFPEGEAPVPASYETLAAIQALEMARQRVPKERGSPGDGPDVLIIRPNEEEIDFEGGFRARRSPTTAHPGCLATPLKAHQAEGLLWLQRAHEIGRPGVLLADDMGLGKTLQGLAFLAWLREGMQTGVLPRAPVAVVAPTGLLENWKAEELRHLARPGLGTCLEAFGKGLAALKRPGPDGQPRLDVAKLKSADWVLTTYETLRDYQSDFGVVSFAAMVFDEAQKIKTPGVRITDAAKAMKADFRVALTGTPVENRLADLWCITDAIHPAVLGDLKTFSATFERAPDPEQLRKLKDTLDTAYADRAPLLLRRLKRDRLPDLPAPLERTIEAAMPPLQREVYEAALADARAGAGRPGQVLEALQRLRAISLHPDPEITGRDEEFIAASARCVVAFDVLDRIAKARERALIFVDSLAFQARLAGVLQRRYGLSKPPEIINGTVAGRLRQARVDRFQANDAELDFMILSPRAGGVGLTLTAANHAMHLSRWWNPAVEDQCTGRVLRIGQTRPVHVHLPLATIGDGRSSFDCNLDALIRRKRQLFQDAFMPPEATEDEREELYRHTVA